MSDLPPGQVQVRFGTLPPTEVLNTLAEEETQAHDRREAWMDHLSRLQPRPSSRGLPLAYLRRQDPKPGMPTVHEGDAGASLFCQRAKRASEELRYRTEFERTFNLAEVLEKRGPTGRRVGLQPRLRGAEREADYDRFVAGMVAGVWEHDREERRAVQMDNPLRHHARALTVGVLRKRVEQQRTAGCPEAP